MNKPPERLVNILAEARALHKQGKIDQSLQKLAEAEKLFPGNPQTLIQLAHIYRDTKRLPEAIRIFEGLVKAYPREAIPLVELAYHVLMAGDEKRAYEVARKAHELAPENPHVLEYAGRTAMGAKRWKLAFDCFETLTKKDPTKPHYFRFLASVLQSSMRYEDAAEVYLKLLDLEPLTAKHARDLAFLYFSARRFEKSAPWFEKAIELDPKDLDLFSGLANCFVQLGDVKRAEQIIRNVLEIEPGYPFAFVMLNELRPDLDSSPHADILAKKIETGECKSDFERSICHLFLGKYFHSKKEYDKAFGHFKSYNDLRFEIMKGRGAFYDRKVMEENIRETARIFSRETLEKLSGVGHESDVPVFIISMPRSGSTLLEQIIASHSKVHGAGEINGLGRVFWDFHYLINEDPSRDIHDIIRSEASYWAEIYLKVLNAPQGVVRATDKMPNNFVHLGMIQILFPRARVIHIKRSPLDTCLSMYSNYFAETYAQTARLEDLGHYYNLYGQLMRHWKKTISMEFMEIQYEDLIAAPEEKAREVLEFCGLEWEPQVMEYYKGKKAAYTLSQIQVSKPIDKAHAGRWKRYEKHIQPLIKTLDPAIVGPLSVTGKKE